jgi:starch-binding outer membrane protein, SusD/RagB family
MNMKMINQYNRFLFYIAATGIISSFSACKKYLEIDLPKDKMTTESTFSNATNTLAAVNGMYTFALKSPTFFNYQGDFLLGAAADEFVYGGSNYYDDWANNTLPGSNQDLQNAWTLFYQVIYQANNIIENVPASPISDSLKAVYMGEAKVFRAFCHLYLTMYWGNVPLIQTTDVTKTAAIGRTPKADVLNAIVDDLQYAESKLPTGTVRNGRFNKYMATALLARVYLYQKNWANAEAKATSLISNTSNFTLPGDLTKVFLRGSKEAIWQVNTASDYNYTYWAGNCVPPAGTTSSNYFYIVRPELYNAFDATDLRLANWIGKLTLASGPFYYDYKYKQTSTPASSSANEDYMLLRLAEQYLIRAEARAQQNNLNAAIDDINAIRTRAGLTALSYGMTQADVLLAVEKERKLELFGEGYGHRWIDLVRTGRADAVLGAEKSATWKSTTVTFPIPDKEILNNPALGQ